MAQANLGQAPHERGLDEYPPEWQEEFKRLSATIFDLANRYQDAGANSDLGPALLAGVVALHPAWCQALPNLSCERAK